MHVSHRLQGITGEGSDGWALFYKARQMKAEGRAVTELTIGEHDIRTDPRILDAMSAAARAGDTGYAPVPGLPSLRSAVAERLRTRTGVPTTADNVLITAGGQAALFGAHHAVLDEGDRALFPDPYYTTYPGTIRALGAVPVPVPTRARDGFQPRAEALSALAPGARSMLINSPNNPTGAVYSAETLDAIAGVVHDHDLCLISDEVYDTQVWHGTHLSPRALPGMAERTLVVGSLSKSHAMTGSRLGWIAGPKEVITRLQDLYTSTSYGVPGYIQQAGLHALDLGTGLEEAVAAPFRRRRALLLELIDAQDCVRVVPSGGAMYLMLDCRATGLSGDAFAGRLLETHGIAVMPGESFGRAAAGHVRVALTIDDTALTQAVATLLRFAAGIAAAR